MRLVKGGIRYQGGSAKKIKVDKDMIQRSRAANIRYKEYLSKQKQAAEEAEKRKAIKEAKRQQLEIGEKQKNQKKTH